MNIKDLSMDRIHGIIVIKKKIETRWKKAKAAGKTTL